MGPNIEPDSGNKPVANIILVVVHQAYQSILMYRNSNLASGALEQLLQWGK